MEEWKEYKLGDFIKIKHGYAFEGKSISFDDNNIVLVTPGNFAIGGGFQEKKCKFFTSEYPEDYVLKADDLIVTMTDLSKDGDTLGYSAKVPFSDKRIYLHNQRIGLVQFKNTDINKDYLYWYMRSPFYQKTVLTTASGSTVKHTSPDRICNISIPVPPLETQKKIAEILSSLDDKIELNNKINTNLEQQAQAILLYTTKYNNFEEVKLSEIAELNPESYSINDNWEYVNYLDTSSITDNIIYDVQYINFTDEKLPSRAKRKISKNDIVYSTVRPNQHHFGIIKTLLPNMLVSTGFTVIRSKHQAISNEYLYLELTKPDVVEKLQQIAEQSVSTFPSVKPSDIGNCNVKVFQNNIADKLNNQLSGIYNRIANNACENKQLSELRDTLLPKLMSGEIEV